MPKNLFTTCVAHVFEMFVNVGFLQPSTFIKYNKVYKEGFYTSFITSLLTTYSQLNGGFLRRNC